MDAYWLRALEEVEQAERRARALRARFGPDAEARCRDELEAFAQADPRRRNLEDVHRALRWV